MLFLGGGAAGVGLSQHLAPSSFLAQFVGLFSFAVPFALGMHFWLGSALIVAVWRRLRHGPAAHAAAEIPGGSVVFVPTCLVLVGAAGLLIGLFGSLMGTMSTVGLYLVLGLAYGTACWLLARSGYLPFPQE